MYPPNFFDFGAVRLSLHSESSKLAPPTPEAKFNPNLKRNAERVHSMAGGFPRTSGVAVYSAPALG